MSSSRKPISPQDSENALRYAFNDNDKSLTTSSFISAKIGHKIERIDIDSVTEQYNFYDGVILLYTLEVIYNNSSHDNLVSVERIA